jgi:NAD+ kinase
MKKIAIIPNLKKDSDLNITARCVTALSGHAKVFLSDEYIGSDIDSLFLNPDELYKTCDIIITLGGDGTLMESLRKAAPYGNCVLGLNLGRLGFLTGTEVESFFNIAFDEIINEKNIHYRMMLKAEIISDSKILGTYPAVNDVVITCASFSHIVSTAVWTNDEYIDTFRGDGLVFSTPTGSTAYSLSAGGPIVAPDMNALIITPICPHMLNTRPLILSDDKVVTAQICEGEKHQSAVTIDGQEGVLLKAGDKIRISKGDQAAKLIMLHGVGFYELLRNKLQGA